MENGVNHFSQSAAVLRNKARAKHLSEIDKAERSAKRCATCRRCNHIDVSDVSFWSPEHVLTLPVAHAHHKCELHGAALAARTSNVCGGNDWVRC